MTFAVVVFIVTALAFAAVSLWGPPARRRMRDAALRAVETDLGPRSVTKGRTPRAEIGRAVALSQLVMQCVVSLAALGASLYVILSKRYGGDADKWAFATVGTVIGYWLKAPPTETSP